MTFGAPAVTGRVPFLDASRRSRSCEAVVRSGSAHLAGTRDHLAQPPPQPGGRLPGRVCPVGPLSIVPRILAGGCLAPPSGRRRDGKAHSARLLAHRMRFCVRSDPKPKFGAPAQPAPQPGGRLPGRVCPVGPLSIVPRILAGGCLAPPPGDDVTERRTLYASH